MSRKREGTSWRPFLPWGLAPLALLLAGTVMAACSFIPSAYRMDLAGSSWTVESIDGQAVVGAARPTITFDTTAWVQTGCRSVEYSWDQDSDGDGIVFNAEEGAPLQTSCPTDLTHQDEALVTALDSTERWTVDGQDAITLHGEHELRLRRLADPGASS